MSPLVLKTVPSCHSSSRSTAFSFDSLFAMFISPFLLRSYSVQITYSLCLLNSLIILACKHTSLKIFCHFVLHTYTRGWIRGHRVAFLGSFPFHSVKWNENDKMVHSGLVWHDKASWSGQVRLARPRCSFPLLLRALLHVSGESTETVLFIYLLFNCECSTRISRWAAAR